MPAKCGRLTPRALNTGAKWGGFAPRRRRFTYPAGCSGRERLYISRQCAHNAAPGHCTLPRMFMNRLTVSLKGTVSYHAHRAAYGMAAGSAPFSKSRSGLAM